MIDKVIILGIRRANQLIPDHEIGQMVGRCGRSYSASGEATLVVPKKDLEQANKYLFGKPKPILSSMQEVENTAFHCIPAIHCREVYDEDSFKRWYSRSLSSVQGEGIQWTEVKDFLIQVECAEEKDNCLILTKLGEISFRFYYSPERIYWLKEKLLLVTNSWFLKEPAAIAWMLGYQHCAIGDANAEELAEFKSEVTSCGLYFHCGELIESYAYYCLLDRRKPKWLKHKIEELFRDIERLFGALKKIAEDCNIDVGKSLETWLECFKRRCPYTIGEMSLEFPGASTTILIELDSLEIHRKDEICRNLHRIEAYGSDALKNFCKQQY